MTSFAVRNKELHSSISANAAIKRDHCRFVRCNLLAANDLRRRKSHVRGHMQFPWTTLELMRCSIGWALHPGLSATILVACVAVPTRNLETRVTGKGGSDGCDPETEHADGGSVVRVHSRCRVRDGVNRLIEQKLGGSVGRQTGLSSPPSRGVRQPRGRRAPLHSGHLR